MKPVITLVGRPNVGKSTLFNRLTASRDALVADIPGLTRDRQYGLARIGERPFIVVDTGGLSGVRAQIDHLMEGQALLAVEEADVVLLLVDGREGLNASDEAIVKQLRPFGKPLVLVVNKTEGLEKNLAGAEFHATGISEQYYISAVHGHGITTLVEGVLAAFSDVEETDEDQEEEQGTRIAVVGRPNVGKSTLVNRLLGEERVLAFDQPGTTRDSIFIPFEHRGQRYTLIDTAGVRRRSRVTESIEKFSVIKTLQAISDANVAILVLDARMGIAEQDARLLGFIIDSGKALIIAVNKWDDMAGGDKEQIKREVERKLSFVSYATIHYISALQGSGIGTLFKAVDRAYESSTRKMSTPNLTRLLERAVAQHAPPLARGRRIKLRYAHQGGRNPPVIVIHGNQTNATPRAYRRYLENYFRTVLKLEGTPVRIEFKSSDNPYKDKKNVLTPRQIKQRKRLVRHVKKKGK